MRRWQERFVPVGCTSKQFQEEYAELLSRVAWTYLVTLTMDPKRFPRSGPESWLKAWQWFIFTWCASCAVKSGLARWGEDGRLKGSWANANRRGAGAPMWVLATEPHRDDRLHVHALVKAPSMLPRLEYSEGHRIWNEARGWAWIEAPKDQGHVVSYVSKYVLKFGPDGLRLSPNFDAPRMTVTE